jgi:hypothetical protein
LKNILKWFVEQAADISILVGIILLAIGLYMIYPAASFAIIGILLIYMGKPKGNSTQKKVK